LDSQNIENQREKGGRCSSIEVTAFRSNGWEVQQVTQKRKPAFTCRENKA